MTTYPDLWKRAPIGGEVEYNWQKQRESAKPAETFGRTPDEAMTVPAYRRFMVDKIRRYPTSYLGWIDNFDESDREVLAGAAELQEAFGYRFVLDSASDPLAVPPGERLTVKLNVRNTGSAPFYFDWPVAVALFRLLDAFRPDLPVKAGTHSAGEAWPSVRYSRRVRTAGD